MAHPVFFGDGTDDPAWVSGGKRIGRNITCDDTSGTDDHAVAYGDSAADNHIARYPAVIADGDGAGIFLVVQLAFRVGIHPSFLSHERVHWGGKGAVRSEEHVVAYGDGGTVQYRQVEVGIEILACLCEHAIVEADGAFQVTPFGVQGEQLVDDAFPLFRFRVVGGVISFR